MCLSVMPWVSGLRARLLMPGHCPIGQGLASCDGACRIGREKPNP